MSANNKGLQIKKIRKSQYRLFTDAEKIEMLNMHNIQKKSQSEIAKHFGTSRQNIHRILKKKLHESNVKLKGGTLNYSSDEVLRRRSLTMAERQKLLIQDAIEVAEKSLSLALFKCKVIANLIENGENIGNFTIEIEKLCKFLQTLLPYILPKQDLKSKEPEKKPLTHLHRMMVKTSNLSNNQ